MNNFLITFSSLNDGFENYFYELSDNIIPIENIDNFKECAVLIPYDYKNLIEPKCFDRKSKTEQPIILPVKNKKKIEQISEIKDILESILPKQKTNNSHLFNPKIKTIDYSEYLLNFQKIQQYLKSGDIYEMNYCIPFVFEDIDISITEIFWYLLNTMQSPFTAIFKYNSTIILSFSPERFLKKEKNILFTEPIKGTAARGKNIEEDEKNKFDLLNSNKERTENAMIVDVCRNDLSKVADKGSVKVDELFTIKTYASVHQMVSKISCKLSENISFKDIIYATFPMASMTGAPKIRAMQIADELEIFPREYYSGCLGIFNNGDFDLSVLIRSIFYDTLSHTLKIWAGSAITIYANPEKEYEECNLKAEKLLYAIKNSIYSKKI